MCFQGYQRTFVLVVAQRLLFIEEENQKDGVNRYNTVQQHSTISGNGNVLIFIV